MVYTKFYELPSFNRREILRYAAAGKGDDRLDRLTEECIEECRGAVKGKVCYMKVPVTVREKEVDLSFVKIQSKDLAKNLKGCGQAVIFGATVGLEMDRLIRRYSQTDLAKAVIMQAVGTERIEALCQLFCRELAEQEKEKGLYLRPRFSPGYGDLSLDLQKKIVQTLNCFKNIGVGLNDSLLMTPSKSVTALAGLCREICTPGTGACSYCDQKDCAFRRTDGFIL